VREETRRNGGIRKGKGTDRIEAPPAKAKPNHGHAGTDLTRFSHSNTTRKSIARVLTVINQKQRQNVREMYKAKNSKCTSARCAVDNEG
jgi:hypothetical protein